MRYLARTFVTAVALHCGAAHAAIFDKDDRVRVAAIPGSALASIGKIRWKKRKATAFLVSKCHVLTVKHVYSDSKSALDRRMTFTVTLQTGREVSSGGVVVASGEFDITAQRANPSLGRGRDWMLVRLDQCLGETFGYLELAKEDRRVAELASAPPLRSAGFPGRAWEPWPLLDPSCRIRGETEEEWLNDCASLPGNSGSPIFQQVRVDGQDRFLVMGMQTSAWDWRSPRPFGFGYSNVATKSGYLAAKIGRHVTTDEHSRLTCRISTSKGKGVSLSK